MRAGELRALDWTDIYFKHRRIHVARAIDEKTGATVPTKWKRNRRIPTELVLMPLPIAMKRCSVRKTLHSKRVKRG